MRDYFDGLNFDGAAEQLMYNTNSEIALYGPAMSGKSFAIAAKAHILCKKYAGTCAVLISNNKQDIFRLFESVLWASDTNVDDIKFYGKKQIRYPNGSVVYLSDHKSPSMLSIEADYIGVLDLQNISELTWNMYFGRCTGRANHTPYAQIVGEYCWNKAPVIKTKKDKYHWIWGRHSATHLMQTPQHNPNLNRINDTHANELGQRAVHDLCLKYKQGFRSV